MRKEAKEFRLKGPPKIANIKSSSMRLPENQPTFAETNIPNFIDQSEFKFI